MQLPLYSFLIIYAVAFIVFFVWGFFNVWHLAKFGMFDFTGKINAFVFIALTIIVLIITALLLQSTPWLDTFNPLGFSGTLIAPRIGPEI